ncbi:MAG: lysophospholipid acyltransferase family protein [Saprospiraceae bacterium]|nr:lysophospholipid acyltransferase family protein [Saprospiraceae bacterium]
MSRLLFYLLVLPVSRLPYPVLYLLSDGLRLVLHRLIGFRRNVVRSNLTRSFPDLPHDRILSLEKAFYRHFCDLLVETIKLFSISGPELDRRCRIVNPEIFDHYVRHYPRIIITSGHFGNWEMAAQAMSRMKAYIQMGIYSPLKDRFMDEKMRRSRGKFGMVLVSRKEVGTAFRQTPQRPESFLFATDQTPSNSRKAWWTIFLHQETPVFFGTEKFAREYGCPVFYTHYDKPKRGFYELTFHLLTEDPRSLPHGTVTEWHTRILEEDIRQNPAIWLWSHRRWKKIRPDDVPLHNPSSFPQRPGSGMTSSYMAPDMTSGN